MQDDCESAALFHQEHWISIKPFSYFSIGKGDPDTALLDVLGFLLDVVRGSSTISVV
jgi:hypothetical protein